MARHASACPAKPRYAMPLHDCLAGPNRKQDLLKVREALTAELDAMTYRMHDLRHRINDIDQEIASSTNDADETRDGAR